MYIELNQSVAEEKMIYLSSQLHNLEQTLEVLIKGPKSFSNDSNPWHLLQVLKSDSISEDHISQVVKALSSSNFNGKIMLHQYIKECLKNYIVFILLIFSWCSSTNCSIM